MDPLTLRVVARHIASVDWNVIDSLRKDIDRFRARVRRLQAKLQAELYGKGPKPEEAEEQAIVKKAVGDARVVLESVKKARELVTEWGKEKTDPKVAQAITDLKRHEELWHHFLADPKGYREKSLHGYGSDKGTPVDIVVDLWSQAAQTEDAIRRAANAVFYAKS